MLIKKNESKENPHDEGYGEGVYAKTKKIRKRGPGGSRVSHGTTETLRIVM